MKKILAKNIFLFFLFFYSELYSEQIVVIGAGLAGLTAAYRLKKEGYDVEIFEARSRPGGRVCTCYFPEGYAELGGQNINDGGKGESIKALAKELNVPIINYNIKHDLNFGNDQKIVHWRDLFKSAPEPTEEKYAELLHCNNLGEVLDKLVGKEKTFFRSMLEARCSEYEGCDVEKISMSCFNALWSYYCTDYKNAFSDTEHYIEFCTVKNGMSTLTEVLCKVIGPCIHYNCPLTKISRDSNRGFLLQVADKIIQADKIILTLPYSTLRDVIIEPDIFPADQFEFIYSLQYGTNAKILIPTRGISSCQCSLNENCYMVFENPVLWLYFGGQSGIFDSSTKENLSKIYKKQLPFLDRIYSGLKLNQDISPVPFDEKPYVKVNHTIGISWINEKYSKGSYSCLAPGQEVEYEKTQIDCGQKIRSLFRSIEKSIFFAGEHTAFEPGTIEGAVESGERAAQMVIHSMN